MPSLRESNPENGKRLKIISLMLIAGTSEIFSPVIGMRGNFTIRIERRPRNTRMRVEPTMVPIVHALVLRICFLCRKLKRDIAVPKKRSGISANLPNLMANSENPETIESTAGTCNGRMNAAATPRIVPIKYFIQSFIVLV